jgi:hypothetical protein
MRSVIRASLGFLSASALIGLQMFGCSAADESTAELEDADASGAVEEQSETSPPLSLRDNRFADLAERFKAVDDLLDANPKDPNALAEVARLRAEVDSRLNVLTTVQVDAGHQVKFYEPFPGVTLVHEWFSQGVKPQPLVQGLKYGSLAQVHQKLRPSESVPEVLLAADRRAAEPLNSLPAMTEADVIAEEASPLIPKISSSCTEFKNAGGCPDYGDPGKTPWCFCNRTGDFTKSHTTNFSDWSIAPYRGSLSLQLSVAGSVLLIDAVPQGEWHWWGTQSGTGTGDKFCNCGTWQACGTMFCFRNHSGAILNASGDGYHYGGIFQRT